MCASATAFLMSMRHVLDTIVVAAAGVFGTRRMRIRARLGAMRASALAGRQAHVEIDLLPHLLPPGVSADAFATWISFGEIIRVGRSANRIRDCR
jgi:hypothetical protein